MKTKGKVAFLLGMLALTAGLLLAYRISERNSYLRIIRANWQTDLPYGCRQLYEAAKIDGAGRWQLMWHVTLPAIRGTIILMLIMKVGSLLNTGYEQIFLMQNAMNRSVSDVFDTYIYTKGIVNGQYSLATAAGLFKSIVSMVMVVGANKIAKLFGESGLY